jgi:hypothetical protein
MAETDRRRRDGFVNAPPENSRAKALAFARPGEIVHALAGAGVFRLDADGAVDRQAMVVSVFPSGAAPVGDLALIQYFDWIVGQPSTRDVVPLAEMAVPGRYILFSCVEEMNDYWERIARHRTEAIIEKRRVKRDGTDGDPRTEGERNPQ